MRRISLLLAPLALLLVSLVMGPGVVYATFPGVNGRIIFTRFVPETNGNELFSIRADGSDERQLTFDPPDHSSLFSNWSPDGSRITIDSDRFNNGTDDIVDIFTMKADGSDIVQLTSHDGFNGEPVYSPDGMKVAFDSDRGIGPPAQGIYLMNAVDGSNVQRVTFAPSGKIDVIPHFAPDGTRIAFTRLPVNCRFNNGRFPFPAGCLAAGYVVNVDGSHLVQITPWGFDTGISDWSPDGTKIAFTKNFDNQHPGSKIDIYVVDPDGKHPKNLTNNPPLAGPCPLVVSLGGNWSPDGSKMVFTQFTCDGGGLWIMNADGSHRHPFTNNFEDISDWGTNQD
jgi:Tol biopolymer transport system component